MSTTFTVSVQVLKTVVPKYIMQLDAHIAKIRSDILDQYLGKTYTVGHLWWKKRFIIVTQEDAYNYITKHDAYAHGEYMWAYKYYNFKVRQRLIKLNKILQSELDVVYVDISAVDAGLIAEWVEFYNITYGNINE